jgi:hypothetical protein
VVQLVRQLVVGQLVRQLIRQLVIGQQIIEHIGLVVEQLIRLIRLISEQLIFQLDSIQLFLNIYRLVHILDLNVE